MSNPPNLHALANLPGAGKAFAQLERDGFIGDDPTLPKWAVVIRASQPVASQIIVHAQDKDEARRIAEKRIQREIKDGDLSRHWDPYEDVYDPVADDVSPLIDG